MSGKTERDEIIEKTKREIRAFVTSNRYPSVEKISEYVDDAIEFNEMADNVGKDRDERISKGVHSAMFSYMEDWKKHTIRPWEIGESLFSLCMKMLRPQIMSRDMQDRLRRRIDEYLDDPEPLSSGFEPPNLYCQSETLGESEIARRICGEMDAYYDLRERVVASLCKAVRDWAFRHSLQVRTPDKLVTDRVRAYLADKEYLDLHKIEVSDLEHLKAESGISESVLEYLER